MIKDETKIIDITKTKPWSPLILQSKLEDLKLYLHQILFQFPRKERYLLCAEIESTLNSALHNTIRMEKKFYKKTTLQDIDIEIGYLKVLMRQSFRAKYISTHTLEVWARKVVEIGKIVGGLIKKFDK